MSVQSLYREKDGYTPLLIVRNASSAPVTQYGYNSAWYYYSANGTIWKDSSSNIIVGNDVYTGYNFTTPYKWTVVEKTEHLIQTVRSGGTAACTITGGDYYLAAAVASLTATGVNGGTAAASYAFVQWQDAGTANPRSITVSADATYTATFAQTTFKITAASEDVAKGTVACSNSGKYYATGITQLAVATPATGYRFTGWYRTGQSVPDYTTTTADLPVLSSDTTYTAKFVSTIYTLTVSSGAGGTATFLVNGETKTSPATVTEGDSVSLTATPLYNYVWTAWTNLALATQSYTFIMPSANVTTAAVFTIRDSLTCTVDKANPSFGTLTYKRGLIDVTFTEVAGDDVMSLYVGVAYTMAAAVTNPALNMFSGWYSDAGVLLSSELSYTFTPSAATNFTIQARFAQLPSYTVTLRASDGASPWDAANLAVVAGCTVALDRDHDFSSPDEWIGGSITATGTAATGWRVKAWSVSNDTGGPGAFQNTSGVNPLTFSLAFDSTIMCVFEKIPLTASVVTDTASEIAADVVEAQEYIDEYTNGETGDSIVVLYGQTAKFVATAAAGYTFGGWYQGATLISASATYSHTMIADIELTAKFKATVTIHASHSVAADDTGTVKIDSGTAGATATLSVILGEACAIKSIATAGSIFEAWFDIADSGFASPIPGYLFEQVITVVDILELNARFVGEADLIDRYLKIANYNNNTQSEDPLIGILNATLPDANCVEITEDEWDVYRSKPDPLPTGPGGDAAGNRFYQFKGSKPTTITAISNASLGFMHWTMKYLIPITPELWPTTPAPGAEHYTESNPVIIGTSPTITIVTNRDYIITAVWGVPTPVAVTLQYGTGSDVTMGGFTMTPETVNRGTVQGGISDVYDQESDITLLANVENGSKFAGWYYDLACTQLISTETAHVFTVSSPTSIFAKFIPDTDAVYKWEGGTDLKMMEWRSKRMVSTQPFNFSAARVYADSYPVTLKVFTASSPDSPSASSPSVVASARDQNGFRLPMARPEKYFEVEVVSQYDVSDVSVATSMGGLIK